MFCNSTVAQHAGDWGWGVVKGGGHGGGGWHHSTHNAVGDRRVSTTAVTHVARFSLFSVNKQLKLLCQSRGQIRVVFRGCLVEQ